MSALGTLPALPAYYHAACDSAHYALAEAKTVGDVKERPGWKACGNELKGAAFRARKRIPLSGR
jgi:hypothetical protein